MFDDLIYDNKKSPVNRKESEPSKLKSPLSGIPGRPFSANKPSSKPTFKKIKSPGVSSAPDCVPDDEDSQSEIPFLKHCEKYGWTIAKQRGMWILHRQC